MREAIDRLPVCMAFPLLTLQILRKTINVFDRNILRGHHYFIPAGIQDNVCRVD
jgi:hypothetical protein